MNDFKSIHIAEFYTGMNKSAIDMHLLNFVFSVLHHGLVLTYEAQQMFFDSIARFCSRDQVSNLQKSTRSKYHPSRDYLMENYCLDIFYQNGFRGGKSGQPYLLKIVDFEQAFNRRSSVRYPML